jgi:hypothetical protein
MVRSGVMRGRGVMRLQVEGADSVGAVGSGLEGGAIMLDGGMDVRMVEMLVELMRDGAAVEEVRVLQRGVERMMDGEFRRIRSLRTTDGERFRRGERTRTRNQVDGERCQV